MTTEAQTTDAGAKSAKDVTAGTKMPASGLNRLQPQTFNEMIQVSNILATSDIVPKDLKGKPANVLLVLMFGQELGITVAQALQNVMVVNGRPSLWGDAVMGLVLASSVYEDSKDEFNEQTMTAIFRAKRKGKDWVVRTFSMADAEKAKLSKKEGPWQEYPKRMLFHRARAWALRDTFADVLKGIRYFEEERDAIRMEKTGEREYAMPTETAAVAPAPAAPAPAPTPIPSETVVEEKKSEGEIVTFKVHSVSKSDFDGEPAICIRDTSKPDAVKYFTDNEAHANTAKAAKEAGQEVGGVWIEKETQDHKKHRWLLAVQVKQ